jgi:hypothetical protein
MLPFARSSMKTKCTPKLDAMDPCQRPRSTGPAAWRNLRQTCGRRPFATAPETPRRAERGSPIMTVSKSGLVQASVPRFAGRRRPERHRAPQRAQSWPARPQDSPCGMVGVWKLGNFFDRTATCFARRSPTPCFADFTELRNSRFARAWCRDDGWSRVGSDSGDYSRTLVCRPLFVYHPVYLGSWNSTVLMQSANSVHSPSR